MKVVWNINRSTAIPVDNIICFNIKDLETCAKEYREKKYKEGYKRFILDISYVICTGVHDEIYTADTMEEIGKYIDTL